MGDILFSGDESKISRGIARVTKGQFSHAMLYVENSVIHATLEGVYSKNPQRLLYENPEKLRALRMRERRSPEFYRAVASFSREKIGSLYSIPHALVAPIRSNLFKNTNSQDQFCSRLVAQAYSSAGVDLVKNPEFCSPNEIAESSLLLQVDDCVRVATEADIKFAERDDPNLAIQQATFEWLKKVRALAKRRGLPNISTQNDVSTMLMSNPSLDKVVSAYIKSTLYPNYYNIDRKINQYRYDVQIFLDEFRGKSYVKDVIARERKISVGEYDRRSRNATAALENYLAVPLEYFHIELQLADRLFDEVKVRLAVLNEVESRIEA